MGVWRAIRRDWLPYAVLAAAGAVVVHHAVRIVQFLLNHAVNGDFALYDVFARIGLRHGWHALYDLRIQEQEWHAFGPTPFYPEIYPPPLAWLVAPFALLPFPVAVAIWTSLLVGALVMTWWLCAPAGRLPARAAHLAFALALPPVAYGVLLGQVVALLALAVAGAWWLLRREHPVAAGLLLSVLAVKPQLAFLVPVALLVAGYRRAVAGFLAGSLAIALVSLVTVGWDGLRTYAVRLMDSTHTLTDFIVPVQRTVPGLLGGGAVAHLAQAAIVAVLVVACWRRRGQGPEFPIAAGLTASLLVTPFVHDQDLAMLLPAVWFTLSTTVRPARVLALTGYLVSFLLATPVPLLLVLLSWAFGPPGVELAASPPGSRAGKIPSRKVRAPQSRVPGNARSG